MSEDDGKYLYKVKASYPMRDPYPKYKIYTNPVGWHCDASLLMECQGKGDNVDNVNIKLYERDSSNIHTLDIGLNERGELQCRLTQQVQVQE